MRPSKGYIDVAIDPAKLKRGYRVWFDGEKRPYTVYARNRHLIACVKPFSLKKTYLYAIVDVRAGVRGTDGFVFSPGWSNEDESKESLKMMHRQGGQVSHRNRVPLVIVRMAKPNAETAKKPLPNYDTE